MPNRYPPLIKDGMKVEFYFLLLMIETIRNEQIQHKERTLGPTDVRNLIGPALPMTSR
jgi:hypothetical protein